MLQAATEVLEKRLRDILREQLGGTYSVGVNYSNTSPEPGYGVTSVQFGSSPENVQTLTTAVMTEIDRLRKEGPSAEDVRAVKEAEKNDLQTAMRQNGYWLSSLQAMHLLGRDPKRILQRTERAESLTQENVHAALRKYFPAERHTEVTLMPETEAASGGTVGKWTAARGVNEATGVECLTSRRTTMNDTTCIARAATLTGFTSAVSSTNGVQLRDLPPMTTLLVRTRNSDTTSSSHRVTRSWSKVVTSFPRSPKPGSAARAWAGASSKSAGSASAFAWRSLPRGAASSPRPFTTSSPRDDELRPRSLSQGRATRPR